MLFFGAFQGERGPAGPSTVGPRGIPGIPGERGEQVGVTKKKCIVLLRRQISILNLNLFLPLK